MRRYLFITCLIAILVLAALFGHRWEKTKKNILASRENLSLLADTKVVVKGRVSDYDTESIILTDVYIRVNSADSQEIHTNFNLICDYGQIEVAGSLMDCFWPKEEKGHEIGTEIIGQGDFTLFNQAENPGEFDMQDFYYSRKIFARIKNLEILEAVNRNSSLFYKIKSSLVSLRLLLEKRVSMIYPRAYSGIVKAMLLGDRNELDYETKKLYQRNGIIHILSISGLHISIIGMGIYRVLRRLGCRSDLSALAGVVILVLYGTMTGFSVSAVRAIGMYCIRMLGVLFKRTYDSLTALGLMCVISLFFNSLYFENSGFYLSYLSVFGVSFVYDNLIPDKRAEGLKRYIENGGERFVRQKLNEILNAIRLSLLSGLSISWVTIPVLAWFYFQVPLISCIINLFVLPVMSLVVVVGFISIMLPGFAFLYTLDCFIFSWFEMLCELGDRMRVGTWVLGRPMVSQIVIYYLIILIWFIVTKSLDRRYKGETQKNRIKVYSCKRVAIFIACLTMSLFIISIKSYENKITFLSVGQGDCIFVETSEGKHFLFDCGSSSKKRLAENIIIPFLKYSKVTTLDGVFLSHSDTDHIGGITELLKEGPVNGIEIKNIYLGYNALIDRRNVDSGLDTKYLELSEAILNYNLQQRNSIGMNFIGSGQKVSFGDFELHCIHPDRDFTGLDENENSLCFLLNCKDVTVLLTGDVQGKGEEKMLSWLEKTGQEKELLKEIRVLKVAHHGSKYSTPNNLLEFYEPTVSVISCGKNNSYGHPHRETLDRLNGLNQSIFRTDEVGAVVIALDNSKIEIETYK